MEKEENLKADDRLTIDELFHRSQAYKSSKEFIRFFDFIVKFDHYSRFNTMLVYLQNDAVTFFGGTSYWRKKFNRGIKENARPYIILAPMGPVMVVYDVMDTIGKESPEEFLKNGLGSEPFEVKGKLHPMVFYKAIEIANKYGIQTTFKDQHYFKSGHITTIFSGKLEIVFNKNGSDEKQFSTLIHELAHLFLGHTGHERLITADNKQMKLPIRKLFRNAEELEAETVSFLLCKRLKLETKSAEYLAGYIKSENDLNDFSYETVIKVADKIDNLFEMQKKYEHDNQLTLFG